MLKFYLSICAILLISCFKEPAKSSSDKKPQGILRSYSMASNSPHAIICQKIIDSVEGQQDLRCDTQGYILGVDTIHIHNLKGNPAQLNLLQQSLVFHDTFKSVYYDTLLIIIDGGKRYIHPQIIQEIESWHGLKSDVNWLEGNLTPTWSSKVIGMNRHLISFDAPLWLKRTLLEGGVEILWGEGIDENLINNSSFKVELLGETFVKVSNSELYIVCTVRGKYVLIGGSDNPKKLINYSKILFDKTIDEK